jgi:hypothetical protein
MTDLTDAASRHWNKLLIRTGGGGATLVRSLWAVSACGSWKKGGRTGPGEGSHAPVTPESRIAHGWWPQPIARLQPNGDRQRRSLVVVIRTRRIRNWYPFGGLGFTMTMVFARTYQRRIPSMAQIIGTLAICKGASIPALEL